MGRKILALIVGLIAAFAVMMIVEMLNSLVVMPPGPEIMKDPAKLKEFMADLPMKAYIVVLIGYFLGSFFGGYIVTKMSRRESPGITMPLIIGSILTIGGILNFFVMLPGQPVWFIAMAFLIYIPVTLLGHRFAK